MAKKLEVMLALRRNLLAGLNWLHRYLVEQQTSLVSEQTLTLTLSLVPLGPVWTIIFSMPW